MNGADIGALFIALMGLWALKELDVVEKFARRPSRKTLFSIGGFSIGLIWGPAAIAAVQGALSGLAAVSGANLAGLTDISSEAMLTIGVVFVAIMVGMRLVRD